MLRIIPSSDSAAVERLLDRSAAVDPSVDRQVAAIIDAVRRDGDRAVLAYARQFDLLDGPIEISAADIAADARSVAAPNPEKKSRAWSSTMRIMTRPRARSIAFVRSTARACSRRETAAV